jgi:hypothetical protein
VGTLRLTIAICVGVYTKKDGLLYNVGILFELKGIREGLELDMYYCQYNPNFILGMEFKEIKLGRVRNG